MDTVVWVVTGLAVAWLVMVGVLLLRYPKRIRRVDNEALLAAERAKMAALDEETRPDPS